MAFLFSFFCINILDTFDFQAALRKSGINPNPKPPLNHFRKSRHFLVKCSILFGVKALAISRILPSEIFVPHDIFVCYIFLIKILLKFQIFNLKLEYSLCKRKMPRRKKFSLINFPEPNNCYDILFR